MDVYCLFGLSWVQKLSLWPTSTPHPTKAVTDILGMSFLPHLTLSEPVRGGLEESHQSRDVALQL